MGIKFPTPWKTLVIKFLLPRTAKVSNARGMPGGGGHVEASIWPIHYFYWNTQWEPLRRKEIWPLKETTVQHSMKAIVSLNLNHPFPSLRTDNWAKVFAQLEVFRLKSYRLSCLRVKTNNQPEGQLVETGTNRLYPTLLKNNHTIDITRRRNKFLKKSDYPNMYVKMNFTWRKVYHWENCDGERNSCGSQSISSGDRRWLKGSTSMSRNFMVTSLTTRNCDQMVNKFNDV